MIDTYFGFDDIGVVEKKIVLVDDAGPSNIEMLVCANIGGVIHVPLVLDLDDYGIFTLFRYDKIKDVTFYRRE